VVKEIAIDIIRANEKFMAKPNRPHRSEWRKMLEIQLIRTANELDPPCLITTVQDAKRWIFEEREKVLLVESKLDAGRAA
jgi:hypothetical protein